MKLSPQDRERCRLFESSKFSGPGFLGNDPRTIDDIVAADSAVLEQHGWPAAEMADRLEGLFDKARSAMGAAVEVRDGVTGTYFESRGRIPSPFRGEGVFEKGEVLLKDGSGRTARLTRLGIHLIRAHAFFQGKGSPYRIEPAEAAVLTGMAGT